MHLEKTKSQGKYTCYLLRETYRQDGKVKHRTIANLSGCSAQEIEAIRLACRTRGHALVVMLGYRIVQELARRWDSLDLTVQEGLDELGSLCATKVRVHGSVRYNKIPIPRGTLVELLKLAEVKLPEALPCRGVVVTTRRKLPERRRKHENQST